MKRSEFIKNLGLGTSGLILPTALLKNKPVKIYDNFIKGMTHYEYKTVKAKLKEGTELILKRELENIYDSFAIAIYYQDLKLGYIAAYENISMANMLDAGVELNAYISTHYNNGDIYKSVSIEVFAAIVVSTDKLISLLNTKPADEANDIYRNFE